MKKIGKYRLSLLAFLLSTGTAHAIATAPGISTNHNNYLGEVLRGQITKDFAYHTAATVGFEAGYRDYRASGTFGWEPVPCQRIKITGEYLTQKIDYNFFSGVTRQWVQQGAVGVNYQYALNDRFQDYLFLTGWYSHAPSVHLGNRTGSFATTAGTVTWTDIRRIAGSNAGGVSPGITTHLWQGNEASLALNWDDAVYDNKNQPSKKAQGFGGTANMSQLFQIACQNFKIGASVAARTPFNYYEGELDWIKPFPTSNLLVGIFGGYTQGKFSLPNTAIAGVNIAYAIDTPAPRTRVVPTQTFLAWMGEPAVRMPQVLAIADENVRKVTAPTCSQIAAPTFTGTIGGQDGPTNTAQTFNSPSQFTGTNLTYSVATSTVAGGPSNVTINPTTGAVTVNAAAFSIVNITITATNQCGASVSSNTFTSEHF